MHEILSNFKPEMDFYFKTSARPFPSSEITWPMGDYQSAIEQITKALEVRSTHACMS